MAPVGVVLVDAGVGVAVGHVDGPVVGVDHGVGRLVERVAAHSRRRLSGVAEGQAQLPLRSIDADGVVGVIDADYRVVRGRGDAVWVYEIVVLAPRAQAVAFRIEDDDGVLSSGEYVDLVFGVDGHSRHLLERPALGQVAPVIAAYVVGVLTGPKYCHLYSVSLS